MPDTDKDTEARVKAAEEQNKKAQEAAQKQIEEEKERQLQAQKDAVGAPTSTAGMTFQEAAKATEELNQPPNFSAEKEKEAAQKPAVSGTPPPQSHPPAPAPEKK